MKKLITEHPNPAVAILLSALHVLLSGVTYFLMKETNGFQLPSDHFAVEVLHTIHLYSLVAFFPFLVLGPILAILSLKRKKMIDSILVAVAFVGFWKANYHINEHWHVWRSNPVRFQEMEEEILSNKATHTTSANARLFHIEPFEVNDLGHGGQV